MIESIIPSINNNKDTNYKPISSKLIHIKGFRFYLGRITETKHRNLEGASSTPVLLKLLVHQSFPMSSYLQQYLKQNLYVFYEFAIFLKDSDSRWDYGRCEILQHDTYLFGDHSPSFSFQSYQFQQPSLEVAHLS